MSRVQKVLEHLRVVTRIRQRQRHKLQLWIDFQHRRRHGVVELRVPLRRPAMLGVHLVQDLPVRNLVVVPRRVPLAQLVPKPSLRVPANQPRVILIHFFHGRVTQFRPLRIVPINLIGIVRVGHRPARFEHPGRNGAEVQNDGVPRRGLHEIVQHRVDMGEVP